MLQKLFLFPQECQRAFWQRLLLALARASYTLTGIDRSLITRKLVHIFSMKMKNWCNMPRVWLWDTFFLFRNGYYSGQWASFSLKAIEEWVKVRVHMYFLVTDNDVSAVVNDLCLKYSLIFALQSINSKLLIIIKCLQGLGS